MFVLLSIFGEKYQYAKAQEEKISKGFSTIHKTSQEKDLDIVADPKTIFQASFIELENNISPS